MVSHDPFVCPALLLLDSQSAAPTLSACQCHDPCHANATQDHGRRIRAGHDDAAGARAGYAGHGAGDAGVCVYISASGRSIYFPQGYLITTALLQKAWLALGTACERGEITSKRSYRPNGYGAGAVNPETESAAALPSRRGYKHPPVLICLYSELEDRRKNTPHTCFRLGCARVYYEIYKNVMCSDGCSVYPQTVFASLLSVFEALCPVRLVRLLRGMAMGEIDVGRLFRAIPRRCFRHADPPADLHKTGQI